MGEDMHLPLHMLELPLPLLVEPRPSRVPPAPRQPCASGWEVPQKMLRAKFSAEANWFRASEVSGVAPICTRGGSDCAYTFIYIFIYMCVYRYIT